MADTVALMTLIFHISHGMVRMQKYRGQSRLLVLLLEHGTLTQRQLIEITERRSATLSEQLESMERAGLITRRANACDRRNVDVTLTEEGRNVASEAERERRQMADMLFGDFTEEEKREMKRILQGVSDKVDAARLAIGS